MPGFASYFYSFLSSVSIAICRLLPNFAVIGYFHGVASGICRLPMDANRIDKNAFPQIDSHPFIVGRPAAPTSRQVAVGRKLRQESDILFRTGCDSFAKCQIVHLRSHVNFAAIDFAVGRRGRHPIDAHFLTIQY